MTECQALETQARGPHGTSEKLMYEYVAMYVTQTFCGLSACSSSEAIKEWWQPLICTSSQEYVNEMRKYFTQKGRASDALPPTKAALIATAHQKKNWTLLEPGNAELQIQKFHIQMTYIRT